MQGLDGIVQLGVVDDARQCRDRGTDGQRVDPSRSQRCEHGAGYAWSLPEVRTEDGEQRYLLPVDNCLRTQAITDRLERIDGCCKLALRHAEEDDIQALDTDGVDDEGAVDILLPQGGEDGASHSRAIGDAHDADMGQIAPLDDAADSELPSFHLLFRVRTFPGVSLTTLGVGVC